jgi:hypothetical protein
MSNRIPCPKCYKWISEHSLKNYWIHKKDHGAWNMFLERQGELQATEQQADTSGRFQGLDFGGDYDRL